MQRELAEIKLNEIVFDEGVYPRENGHDPHLVQLYARDIEQIEQEKKFISINADNVLLDGRHRMLAYKKNADGNDEKTVFVWRYPVTTQLASLRLACELQDKGKSLVDDDRVASAKKLYNLGMNQKEIASVLSVSASTVSQWLSRTIKEEKEKQKKQVIDMWMACHTQEEIADKVGIPQRTTADWIENFSESLDFKLSLKFNFQDDFEPPIYNIWKAQNKTNKVDHFGNSEERWLENLLYLYTNPFDIIVDPFAGGGSTIDVCRRRGRRYFVSDRKPIVERENEIRKFDITDGLPAVPRWKDVKMVYLDPPYWKQAEGKYSDDAQDLANMSLDEFNKSLSGVITDFSKKLSGYDEPKYIAMIIQPTQWKSPDKNYIDHVVDMIRTVNLPIDMRYSVPYESQQYTAQMVNWSKENRKTLVLTREIVVWRIN